MRRIPNLDTAIGICKSECIAYRIKQGKKHIKFYVNGMLIVLGKKKSNPDKVRKNIKVAINSKTTQ